MFVVIYTLKITISLLCFKTTWMIPSQIQIITLVVQLVTLYTGNDTSKCYKEHINVTIFTLLVEFFSIVFFSLFKSKVSCHSVSFHCLNFSFWQQLH